MRNWFSIMILILLIGSLTACGGAKEGTSGIAKEDKKKFVIGYQKFGTLNILKAEGNLDKRLKEKGYSVKWVEFPAGPQLLEALNVGSVDFGHTGEAPPVFAQAAGAPLAYVGNEPPNPKGEAIVVPENSPIKQLEELKGKKIALNKGSNVHYLLVQALKKANLKLEDIKPVYLPPADARAAFERGSVDAWVIWDPFLAAAEETLKARILQDGVGLVKNREYFLATKDFAKNHKDVQSIIFDELKKTDDRVEKDPKKAAEFLSPQVNISVPALLSTLERRSFGLEPINEATLEDQQKIADTFFELKLIPKKVDIEDATVSN